MDYSELGLRTCTKIKTFIIEHNRGITQMLFFMIISMLLAAAEYA